MFKIGEEVQIIDFSCITLAKGEDYPRHKNGIAKIIAFGNFPLVCGVHNKRDYPDMYNEVCLLVDRKLIYLRKERLQKRLEP